MTKRFVTTSEDDIRFEVFSEELHTSAMNEPSRSLTHKSAVQTQAQDTTTKPVIYGHFVIPHCTKTTLPVIKICAQVSVRICQVGGTPQIELLMEYKNPQKHWLAPNVCTSVLCLLPTPECGKNVRFCCTAQSNVCLFGALFHEWPIRHEPALSLLLQEGYTVPKISTCKNGRLLEGGIHQPKNVNLKGEKIFRPQKRTRPSRCNPGAVSSWRPQTFTMTVNEVCSVFQKTPQQKARLHSSFSHTERVS